MKRSKLIKSVILFFSFILSKPSSVFASINSIKIGKIATYFLVNGFNKNSPNKKQWSLDNFSVRWLIFYFYPKGFSNGCNLEANRFQDNLFKYKKLNTSIVGISATNEKSHDLFCTFSKPGYILLSDKSGDISKLYDSWSNPYSKRNTFSINPEGTVVFKWIGVRPLSHSQEVLEELHKKQTIYA